MTVIMGYYIGYHISGNTNGNQWLYYEIISTKYCLVTKVDNKDNTGMTRYGLMMVSDG